ncbi:MAG TPA: dTMP kinase [Nautiliaceae bacterium]|nr:dTMP kinase [Nautiliaceae bacterium]
MYVVFEGIDGSGKTTIINELSKDKDLKKHKIIIKKEPFDKNFLESCFKKIRSWDEKNKAICLSLAFAYDRVFLEKKFEKYYNKYLVLSDRSFVSSLAYQSIYIELDWIFCINKFFRKPDLLIYLDVNVENALKRIKERSEKGIDYFEKKEFLEKLKKSYEKILDFLKNKDYKIFKVNANKELDFVKKEVKKIIIKNLKEQIKDQSQKKVRNKK